MQTEEYIKDDKRLNDALQKLFLLLDKKNMCFIGYLTYINKTNDKFCAHGFVKGNIDVLNHKPAGLIATTKKMFHNLLSHCCSQLPKKKQTLQKIMLKLEPLLTLKKGKNHDQEIR